MAKKTKQPKYYLSLLDQHTFLSGAYIGAGAVVGGAKNMELGFRFVDEKGNVLISTDLSYQNALILAGTLIKACHLYDELKREGINPNVRKKAPKKERG